MSSGNLLLAAEGQPIRSANITADPATGLGHWTPAQLAAALRTGQRLHGPVRYPMPKYLAMIGEEAQGLYAYLQTVPRLKGAALAAK